MLLASCQLFNKFCKNGLVMNKMIKSMKIENQRPNMKVSIISGICLCFDFHFL